MSGDIRPIWMEFDGDALARNHARIVELAGPSVKVIASLKGDAYGHGAVEVARRLAASGVYMLSTGSMAEALAIREAGIRTPILIFAGALAAGIPELVRAGLIPTVTDLEQARAAAGAGVADAPVFIKVDAGLNRVGVPLADALPLICSVAKLPGVRLAGVYTHLAFGDAAGRDWARDHLAEFDGLLAAMGQAGVQVEATQALASAGLVAGLESAADSVCPGHILYGLAPADPDVADMHGFEPVLRAVRGRLIHVGEHPLADSDRRGGFLARAEGTPTRVGVVPFGLADGNRPPARGLGAGVLVRGRRAPVIAVSLEHLTIDLSDDDEVTIGDTVTVIGAEGTERITLDEVAGWWRARKIDVIMSLSGRLPRHYLSPEPRP